MNSERAERKDSFAMAAELRASRTSVSRQLLVGVASGVLFAIGLALSGMTDPGRVLAFLDVAGAWDPRLLLVMGGAVSVHFAYLRLTRSSSTAHADGAAAPLAPSTPSASGPMRARAAHVDSALVLGAALFGIGWGMSGYCPGPALSALAFGRTEAWVFVPSLLSGMALFRLYRRRRA